MIPPGKSHSVRLCATFVKTVNVPDRYGDGYGGHGLSLLVTPRKSGGFSKTWAQAISPNGTKTSLGLGSYPVVTLAMAREKALANARALAEGHDPRRRMQKVPTFDKANEIVVAIHARHWKSGRTEGQWRASMRGYVLPRLARKRVDAVTTADVMAVLLPIWSTKRVTAGRVRQRIGAVMKWAVAQGYRDDNPAGDVVSAALPKTAVRKQHMRALPHAEVGAALARAKLDQPHPGAASRGPGPPRRNAAVRTISRFSRTHARPRSGGEGGIVPSCPSGAPCHREESAAVSGAASGGVRGRTSPPSPTTGTRETTP